MLADSDLSPSVNVPFSICQILISPSPGEDLIRWLLATQTYLLKPISPKAKLDLLAKFGAPRHLLVVEGSRPTAIMQRLSSLDGSLPQLPTSPLGGGGPRGPQSGLVGEKHQVAFDEKSGGFVGTVENARKFGHARPGCVGPEGLVRRLLHWRDFFAKFTRKLLQVVDVLVLKILHGFT